MSRQSKTLELTSTVIYSATASSRADQISVTIQNPSTNTGNVEIAWDNVDTTLIAGNGILLVPGDIITLGGLPVNSNSKIGVLGLTTASPPKAVRVIVTQPTQP